MIKARGLARRFTTKAGPVDAVKGVDIEVAEGELVGFLGPNGAGKSTTLRMLTTLLQPTAGEAVIAGHDLLTDPAGVRRNIGYVGQKNGSGQDQRVADELEFQARFYGLSKHHARRKVADLLERFDLQGLEKRGVITLSGGQQRRLDIAMGMLHDPQLLFLDEPSTALDPQSRRNLWDHIRQLKADGVTVFLTTHYLDEADFLSDRLLVIDHGSIVGEGSPDELKQRVSGDLVVLGTPQASIVASKFENAVVEGEQVSFRIPNGDRALPGLLRDLDNIGVELHSVQVHRPTLDDVFLTMTGRSLREEANAA
ncbi:ATP-binding cassette domain-containing protein [Lentzea flaviverrucosa]|uniref:ABC-2 type transport system ATP-binding protein n=1 Tax=Lentzea flaviverrucosa TaxID=200379 RepID=A0A1H9M8A3_9PSEU|nr:ATP-binding cassette domain-containing protein [Lentzea flaviverrucosa]RDI31035.1 ABC-2 type transport system ATP-binding protein [Lentzea flaviverrucosa]SER19801.1 ABC-2 type transport system ATP-binding protein [Lentzea flaviverrucosa]